MRIICAVLAILAISSCSSGSQDRRELPAGVTNGDIVESGVLWFVWDNTKSRIWMPYSGPDGYIDSFQTQNTNVRLTGDSRKEARQRWSVMVLTSEDVRGIEQVFIVDTTAGKKYPVGYKTISKSELESIEDAPLPFTPIVG